jgi:hypothetical protein
LEEEIVWLRSWVARRRDELVDALWDRPPWHESTYPTLGLVVDFVARQPSDLLTAERQRASGSDGVRRPPSDHADGGLNDGTLP